MLPRYLCCRSLVEVEQAPLFVRGQVVIPAFPGAQGWCCHRPHSRTHGLLRSLWGTCLLWVLLRCEIAMIRRVLGLHGTVSCFEVPLSCC